MIVAEVVGVWLLVAAVLSVVTGRFVAAADHVTHEVWTGPEPELAVARVPAQRAAHRSGQRAGVPAP